MGSFTPRLWCDAHVAQTFDGDQSTRGAILASRPEPDKYDAPKPQCERGTLLRPTSRHLGGRHVAVSWSRGRCQSQCACYQRSQCTCPPPPR